MKNLKDVKKIKYFRDLDDQDFNAYLRCIQAQIRSVLKDESIIYDGDRADVVVIIISGSARSYSIDEDGNHFIIADYVSESVFGIEQFTGKQKVFHEYLTALEDTTVIICDAFRFLNPCQNRCRRHIESMKATFDELSRLLSTSKRRVAHICKSKTRQKVMSYLTSVKSRTSDKYFTIPYNRQELADYLGLERTALSAELSAMKRDGLIDYDKNDFRILKKAANK